MELLVGKMVGNRPDYSIAGRKSARHYEAAGGRIGRDGKPRLPQVIIIAGPNGAGKSTLATRLVPRGVPFLNADNIARERAAPPGPSADLAAGRILLQRFAIETNLANRTLSARIPAWQAKGYSGTLAFIWLPSADIAVQRVAKRVQSGGHNIPEKTIRRRYSAGLQMFLHTYRPLADSWRVYDNSYSGGAILVAQARVRERTIWQRIIKENNDD